MTRPNCDQSNPAHYKFCLGCGAALQEPPVPSDLEGALDPPSAHEVVQSLPDDALRPMSSRLPAPKRARLRFRHARVVFVALGWACRAQPSGSASPVSPVEHPAQVVPEGPTPALGVPEHRLRALAVRLDALAVDLMRFWKTHGPDHEHGGFHGMHDRAGAPGPQTDKGLIQQSRHLWSLSTWYARRESTPEVRQMADDVYAFISEHFASGDGEFVFKTNRTGTSVVDPHQQLYAESFAVLALATYANVFDLAVPRDQALACFRSFDRRTHDGRDLGYDQTRELGWLAPGAEKGTNTHIHLLESFTELYRLTRAQDVRTRLNEMLEITATKLVQPTGYAHKEFLRDWTPHGPPVVSYGHDLETTWLLMDALEAAHRDDPAIVEAATRMGVHAAEFGYDTSLGGYFEEGVPSGPPTKREKVWWVQAEALPGLWWLYRLTDDPRHLDRLEGTLTWIEQHQRDSEYGEWFWGIQPDGAIGPRGDHKGEEWKTNYHALRALVYTSDWITAALTSTE